ncbi:hypothetical protein CEXT_696101 [Caerostris extrusa]|uniref:Uncharacterized protein n=1 Tax=Caerostris extrusa TaxID=172846 RepID=A0AAV4XGU2_CAEEX|nr:hypothetical protein CEXT_696101 [Caerostris extrusa]
MAIFPERAIDASSRFSVFIPCFILCIIHGTCHDFYLTPDKIKAQDKDKHFNTGANPGAFFFPGKKGKNRKGNERKTLSKYVGMEDDRILQKEKVAAQI